MKKVFLLIIILFVVSTTSAQVSKPFTLWAGVGLTPPSQPSYFDTDYKIGLHGFGGIEFGKGPFLKFIGKLELHSISRDWDKGFTTLTDPSGNSVVTEVEGGKIDLTMFGVDAKLAPTMPGAPLKPYALAGIGWAKISQADITSSVVLPFVDYSRTEFYYEVGGGIEFKLIPVLTMFLQARYINIGKKTVSDDVVLDNIVVIPITVGVKL